jgi:hypothetical protein
MSTSKTDRRKKQRSAPARANTQRRDFSQPDVRRRFLCDTFLFWLGCPHTGCKRQRRCVGDASACFDRFWWLVPENHKVHLRAYVKARVAGAPHHEACAAAEKEVVRQARYIAEIDAASDAKIAARRSAENAARHAE